MKLIALIALGLTLVGTTPGVTVGQREPLTKQWQTVQNTFANALQGLLKVLPGAPGSEVPSSGYTVGNGGGGGGSRPSANYGAPSSGGYSGGGGSSAPSGGYGAPSSGGGGAGGYRKPSALVSIQKAINSHNLYLPGESSSGGGYSSGSSGGGGGYSSGSSGGGYSSGSSSGSSSGGYSSGSSTGGYSSGSSAGGGGYSSGSSSGGYSSGSTGGYSGGARGSQSESPEVGLLPQIVDILEGSQGAGAGAYSHNLGKRPDFTPNVDVIPAVDLNFGNGGGYSAPAVSGGGSGGYSSGPAGGSGGYAAPAVASGGYSSPPKPQEDPLGSYGPPSSAYSGSSSSSSSGFGDSVAYTNPPSGGYSSSFASGEPQYGIPPVGSQVPQGGYGVPSPQNPPQYGPPSQGDGGDALGSGGYDSGPSNGFGGGGQIPQPPQPPRQIFVDTVEGLPGPPLGGNTQVQPQQEPEHHNIIFVKAPIPPQIQTEVILPPQPQSETKVYVLTKQVDADDNDIRIISPPPTKPPKPEVFFIRYAANAPKEPTFNQFNRAMEDIPPLPQNFDVYAPQMSGGYNVKKREVSAPVTKPKTIYTLRILPSIQPEEEQDV
ncbi:loricrin [Folsomia candida]|nr:loricrin [Folsomia candida]